MTRSARIVVDGLRQHVAGEVSRLALNIVAGLIEDTPVDTGWARANWVVSIGVPSVAPVGSRESPDTGAQQAGIGLLANYNLSQGVIYISNHVPYIQALNEGHSAQAPAGFVQLRVDREAALFR